MKKCTQMEQLLNELLLVCKDNLSAAQYDYFTSKRDEIIVGGSVIPFYFELTNEMQNALTKAIHSNYKG